MSSLRLQFSNDAKKDLNVLQAKDMLIIRGIMLTAVQTKAFMRAIGIEINEENYNIHRYFDEMESWVLENLFTRIPLDELDVMARSHKDAIETNIGCGMVYHAFAEDCEEGRIWIGAYLRFNGDRTYQSLNFRDLDLSDIEETFGIEPYLFTLYDDCSCCT